MAFVTGLIFGAGHCVGMCGGFVTGYTLGRPGLPAAGHLAYNAGRILTYSVLGGFMGFLGSVVDGAGRLTGIQGIATALAGLFMIAWGVARWRGTSFLDSGLPSPFRFGWFKAAYRRISQSAGPGGPLLLGLLLGFLPCGLVTTMEIQAAGAGSVAGGSLVMLSFGLGTAPALMAFGGAAGWIGRRCRDRLDRAAAAAVAGAALLSLLRGLAENGLVPHLNPWLW